ncbi:DinB family protein [Granulicella rosea]|nr:DUF1572 family protein [Granulicella rosea]
MRDPVAETFLSFSVRRMQMSERDLNRCLDRLTEEQAWRRGAEHENSVGNLLLHLEGNLRQWVLHGIAGQPDVRVRDEEFSLAPTVTFAEARAHFHATLSECCVVIGELAPARLLEIIDPQPTGTWRSMPILEAIYQIVGHLQLHTGQVILLTKQMCGTDLDLSLPRKR